MERSGIFKVGQTKMQTGVLGPLGAALVLAYLIVASPSTSQAATNQSTDRVYLLEIVDSTGVKTYRIVPLEQYHRLRAEASLRNRFQPKALSQTKESWKETYNGISKAFPQNVASPESVTSLGLFTSQEAARNKLMELRSKAEQRRAADDGKLTSIEKQIKALKDDIAQLGGSAPYSVKDRDIRIQADRNTLRILERDYAEQTAKKAKQEEDLQEARSVYEKKLTALIDGAAD